MQAVEHSIDGLGKKLFGLKAKVEEFLRSKEVHTETMDDFVFADDATETKMKMRVRPRAPWTCTYECTGSRGGAEECGTDSRIER